MTRHLFRAALLLALLTPLQSYAFFTYTAEPIEAWVVDAATNQPLEGVIVVAHWQLKGGLEGGNPVGQMMVLETVTDAKGRFHFPGWGPKWPPLNGELKTDSPGILLFKSGYAYRALDNGGVRKTAKGTLYSEWNSKMIKMAKFKGMAEKYAKHIYDLGQEMNLGLALTDKFKNTNGDDRSIADLIGDGARFEDNLSLTNFRPLNHFFNPIDGTPLNKTFLLPPPLGTVNKKFGFTSPDWVLEDKGSIDGALGFGKQEFSYRDARQYFFDALTQTDKTKREENFGRTFQSLGQIVHHIQDMAQPQHVRNDSHLDIPINGVPDIPGIENPSVYEKYTNRPAVRDKLPTNFSLVGYDINDPKFVARFNKPRNFWETATGEGIAQFTNFNFVSAGTNFDNPGIFNFPLFTPTLRSEIAIQDLCANAIIPCDNPNLKGKMTFYGNVVDRV